ncbi:MAG: DUF2807 domain-containing protein [Bacteroidales bacterium]|nr:DUF2807 domain-containing protein [Bacteroidales bacterium]
MKKTCFILAALLLTFFMADARTVKKVYEIDDFTGIKATSAFEVVVEHSDEFKVEIEISDEFLPFLLVKNRGGVLELSFTRLPFRLKQKNRTKVVQAVISMPELTSIELSGASTLSSNDQFTNPMNRFVIELKGGSEIKNLNVKAPEVVVSLKGASKAVVSLRSGDVDVDLSGASRLELSGEATELDAVASGASKLLAEDFEVEDISVKASGASTAEVRPTSALTVELTGASKCRYYGDDENLKIRTDKIAGASTLKHDK